MTDTPRRLPNIFLDLDGVIADFDTHAITTGVRATHEEKPDFKQMDRVWWAEIPVFDGAFKFYKELTLYGKVRFLTAAIMNPGCHSGKADWIITFNDKGKWALKDLIICPRVDKPLLSMPGRVLIDDNEETIHYWNEAGGYGIHHAGSYADTMKRVRKVLG